MFWTAHSRSSARLPGVGDVSAHLQRHIPSRSPARLGTATSSWTARRRWASTTPTGSASAGRSTWSALREFAGTVTAALDLWLGNLFLAVPVYISECCSYFFSVSTVTGVLVTEARSVLLPGPRGAAPPVEQRPGRRGVQPLRGDRREGALLRFMARCQKAKCTLPREVANYISRCVKVSKSGPGAAQFGALRLA